MLLLVIANVFIASTLSIIFFIRMIENGYAKSTALPAAILLAIGTYAYILWNHKIREFINKTEDKNE
ncbi:hypothetical protein UFOVP1290_325 [uncultured Caudovirales phage]|uniref:Uncharacterized protein n=1 Tax=uncultured Caudovirales phage TaxID=2100421 RepID=A0A6J5RX18_9CAUD|nr:hypothetical protein UFOVP1290_325 [uncultured Caudovirales phage]